MSIADIYHFGPSSLKNYSLAHSWYLKAARIGEDRAYVQLSMLYQTGQGVERDEAKAKIWLQMLEFGNLDRKIAEILIENWAKTDPGMLYGLGLHVARLGLLG